MLIGEMATPKSLSVQEAGWARDHYEKVRVSAFIKGLQPEIKRQLQFEPASTSEGVMYKIFTADEAIADNPPLKGV